MILNYISKIVCFVYFIFLKFFCIFLERREGREKERERNTDLVPLTAPQPGTWPATQACAHPGV